MEIFFLNRESDSIIVMNIWTDKYVELLIKDDS